MSVTAVRDTNMRNTVIQSKFRFGVYTATLAGTLTVGESFPPVLMLDPDGAARNVDLPAEADSVGLAFLIVNMANAAEDITVRDDAAGTIVTVSQNEAAWVVCNGTAWRGLVGANT